MNPKVHNTWQNLVAEKDVQEAQEQILRTLAKQSRKPRKEERKILRQCEFLLESSKKCLA